MYLQSFRVRRCELKNNPQRQTIPPLEWMLKMTKGQKSLQSVT